MQPSPPAPELDLEEPRTRRIVDAALRLAEEGGFDAVRLREVASEAGVALRTLYKRFAGKDDLLYAVLEGELAILERTLGARELEGETPVERVREFFEITTAILCGRPKLGRAVMRALTGSGQLSRRAASFHDRIDALIICAIEGRPLDAVEHDREPGDAYNRLAAMLQHVWFSALIGWSTGLHEVDGIVAAVGDAAALVLEPPELPSSS